MKHENEHKIIQLYCSYRNEIFNGSSIAFGGRVTAVRMQEDGIYALTIMHTLDKINDRSQEHMRQIQDGLIGAGVSPECIDLSVAAKGSELDRQIKMSVKVPLEPKTADIWRKVRDMTTERRYARFGRSDVLSLIKGMPTPSNNGPRG